MLKGTTTSNSTQTPERRSVRERVGLLTYQMNPVESISTIVDAEAAGVRQIWRTQGTPLWDALTVFAAAAVQTTSIRLGTAIVPTYPHHPLVLAQQVLALGNLAPERFRLGIGPSNRLAIEGNYGIPMTTPLEHLREYITVLRAALWKGEVDHRGRFYSVQATLPETSHIPILISALREKAFHLAGELTDGAISWVCPVPYLLKKALPALRAGAEKRERPTPPLVAHVMVALGQDRQEIRTAVRAQFDSGRFYGRLPFYAAMFAEAGFPVSPDGSWSDALIDTLVISGNEAAITDRLAELLEMGLDELLVMPILREDTEAQIRLTQLVGQLPH